MAKASPARSSTDAAVLKALQVMPNIGPRMADDLIRLGIRSVRDLVGRDPMQMYDAISALDGVRHDPCVLDSYMAAIDHATTGSMRPWWDYTPRRKALLKKLAETQHPSHSPEKSRRKGKAASGTQKTKAARR